MVAFSSLKHFGDDFGNADVARQVAFFLNQRDKIAMSTSARGVREVVKHLLPTSTKYATTVKPNLVSVFLFDNGVYSVPIHTFGLKDGETEDMVTYAGSNEDSDYSLQWYMYHVHGRHREDDDLRIAAHIRLGSHKVTDMQEMMITERLRESNDICFRDDFRFPYTPGILNAIGGNTSIVQVDVDTLGHHCRCNLFRQLSRRSTDITGLTLTGGICREAADMIADGCVRGLKKLSVTHCMFVIDAEVVETLCEAVADVGILEGLEISKASGEYFEWGYSLERVLDTCPLTSLSITRGEFEDYCVQGMVRALPKLGATRVKITECDFGLPGDWMEPVLDALFSNTSIRWLDLSFTEIGDESIGTLIEMVTRGSLTKLAIGWGSIGHDGITSVMRATTHVDSNLKFISICGNDIDHPDIFQDIDETSLKAIHVGELGNDATFSALAEFMVAKLKKTDSGCVIDTRDYGDVVNSIEEDEPWPW